MTDKPIDKALIEAAEAYINQLIAQMLSNPSPGLLFALTVMINIPGVDKGIIARAEQAIMDAGQKLTSASMAAVAEIKGLGLDAKQTKLVAEFYASLGDLEKEVKHYAETLEEIKKNTEELARLVKSIEQAPFSKEADEARAIVGHVLLGTIEFLSILSIQAANCERQRQQCNKKHSAIENDTTLTPKQKQVLMEQATKEMVAVEEQLSGLKGQAAGFDSKLVADLEIALHDMVAAQYCKDKDSKEQDYMHIRQEALSDKAKGEIYSVVQEIKALPHDERQKRFEGFKQEFIDSRIAEFQAVETIKGVEDTSVEIENTASNIDSAPMKIGRFNRFINEPTATSAIKSIQEAHEEKQQTAHNPENAGFAETVKKSKEPSSPPLGRS